MVGAAVLAAFTCRRRIISVVLFPTHNLRSKSQNQSKNSKIPCYFSLFSGNWARRIGPHRVLIDRGRLYAGRGRVAQGGHVGADYRARLSRKATLPPGYYLTLGRQFENFIAARRRLMVVVPDLLRICTLKPHRRLPSEPELAGWLVRIRFTSTPGGATRCMEQTK